MRSSDHPNRVGERVSLEPIGRDETGEVIRQGWSEAMGDVYLVQIDSVTVGLTIAVFGQQAAALFEQQNAA